MHLGLNFEGSLVGLNAAFEGVNVGRLRGLDWEVSRGFDATIVIQGLKGLAFRDSGPPQDDFSFRKFLGSFDV